MKRDSQYFIESALKRLGDFQAELEKLQLTKGIHFVTYSLDACEAEVATDLLFTICEEATFSNVAIPIEIWQDIRSSAQLLDLGDVVAGCDVRLRSAL